MNTERGRRSALLRVRDTLILDEPVNGLDREGIRWIGNLLCDHMGAVPVDTEQWSGPGTRPRRSK